MKFFDFLKIGRGSANRRLFRPSVIKEPRFFRKKEAGPKQEPSIFNKTGYTTKKKLKEKVIKSHAEVRNIPGWHLREKKTEVFGEYFPDQKKKYYSKKEVQKKIQDLSKSKMYKPTHERKKITKQIKSLKQASGL